MSERRKGRAVPERCKVKSKKGKGGCMSVCVWEGRLYWGCSRSVRSKKAGQGSVREVKKGKGKVGEGEWEGDEEEKKEERRTKRGGRGRKCRGCVCGLCNC